MSNTSKLEDDAARHRGFHKKAIKDGAHPMNVSWDSTDIQGCIAELSVNMPIVSTTNCQHNSKRKEGIRKLFWICNDCKQDLGDV